MILWYIRYIIVSNNWGRMWGGVDTIWSMLKWYLTMTIVMYQVTSATCCKDHIPRWKDKRSYWRKLIWSIRKRYATMKNHVSFHTSHVLYRPYNKKRKRKVRKLFLKEGTLLHDFVKIIIHTWYWQLSNKFSDLLIETLFAVKPQAYVV